MRGALFVLPLLLAVPACSDGEPNGDASLPPEATQSCDGVLKPADPKATPPADVPTVDSVSWYELQTQGSSRYFFGAVKATDIIKLRDDAAAKLTAGGFTIDRTDEEPPVEAEASFSGKYEGSVQVLHLCTGHVRIRLRISPKI